MGLKIADHLFYGPFPVDTVTVRANQTPVVFAIVAKGGEPWLPSFRLVDIDHSPDEGVVVAQHPRRAEWNLADGELQVYLLDVPRKQGDAQYRRLLAEEIRTALTPSGGDIPLSGGM